jgi:hypothetical protein
VDIRSDIYSLGASLYHMVTGERPFDGPTPTVVMTKHVTEELVPPRQRNPLTSERASQVILKMMGKKREDRYQTPTELITDLQNLIAGKAPVFAKVVLTQGAVLPRTAEAGARPVTATRVGRRSGFPTGLALAAVVVIAVATGVFLSVFRGGNTPQAAPVDVPEEPPTKPTKPSDPNSGGNPVGPVVDADEKKAKEWFDDNVLIQKRNSGDPAKAFETIDTWNNFIEKYRGTSWAEKGRVELDGFKASLEQAAQDILDRKKGEVEALEGFANFLGAIEVLQKDFPKEYLKLTAVGKKIEDEIAAIRDRMMEKYRNDMLSADALEKGKKYDEAIAVCEAARKYVDPAKFAEIDTRIGALREAGKSMLAEAQAEAARQCEELRKNLKAALLKKDYAGAKGLCSAAEKLGCYKWMRDFVVAFVQDITWLEDLMKDCRQGAERLADAEQKTVISLRSGKVMLVRDKGKICQRCIENNNAIIGLNFDVLSDEDVILIAGYALSTKDMVRHMKFGLRHYYGKNTAKAREQLIKAKDAGIERAAVYLDWIEQADMTDADRAAKKLYEEACAAFAAEDWAGAVRMFNELAQNHFNTEYYKRVKDDVKKKLTEASKRAESPDGLLAKRFPKAKIEALDKGAYRVSYDFSDPEQRKEWISGKLPVGRASQAQWDVDKDAGTLRGDGRGVLTWKGAFTGDMVMEFTLITDSDRNIGALVCAGIDKADSYALFFGLEMPGIDKLDPRPVMILNLRPEFPFLDPVGRADEPRIEGGGKRYKVRFARVAGTLTVSIDDKQIMSEKHDKLRGGTVALMLNGARADFDDVRITGVPDINVLKAPEPKEPVQGPDEGPPPEDGRKPGGKPGGPGRDPG